MAPFYAIFLCLQDKRDGISNKNFVVLYPIFIHTYLHSQYSSSITSK